MRQHDLHDSLERRLTAAEAERVVDRTGELWKEKTAEPCSLEESRAFLVVGPPVIFADKRKVKLTPTTLSSTSQG